MLSVSKYSPEYVDECRARFDSQVSAFAEIDTSGEAFEAVFFSNALLALDHHFCHRARGVEGKDGNPLNEVRVICSSLMENDGRMAADKSIRLKPDESLLDMRSATRSS